MISGALEIICGVDAGLVHPLLLPASQGQERFGYIVIAYDDSPEMFDILFVRGNSIQEYAGIHHDLRTLLSEHSVRMSLEACALRCRVYFFSVSRQGFDRFLRTFHCTPSVNVVIDRLSKKQIAGLLTATGCTNGILEIDRLSHPFPVIDLTRFHSADELLGEALRLRQGRMILYDLELNTRIHQRAEPPGGELPRPSLETGAGDPEGEETQPPAADSPGGGEIAGVFIKVLKDFLAALTGVYGDRMKARTSGVISRHFPSSSGDPDLTILTAESAPLVLSVIEDCVKDARFGKKKEIRAKALEAVGALFETHNEVLRNHGLLENVQQCYQNLER